MLKALSYTSLASAYNSIPVRTPLTYFYMPCLQIQFIENLEPAIDLASILTSCANVTLRSDYGAIGFALGSWLRAFHLWAKEPRQEKLRRAMSENETSQHLKWRTTYDTIVDVTKELSMTVDGDLDVLREVRGRALRELEQKPQREEWCGLIHGDFWTGNVLFDEIPDPQLYVIDFEFGHIGHRATDLGQMIGDLLEKSYINPSTRTDCETMITAFVRGYGTLSTNMANRVVIHAGVHIINWCSRHPGAELKAQVKELVHKAIRMIVIAWQGDKARFDGEVLGCLFRGSH
ncbi:kinase-like domain-containing protein [Boeremia exigua]|uniref:kinase-like domain-containing protein n=1 Tax=Boeremia exigua TaxID=749465 RepID=UPI001E8DC089|nr:kinase-like domain-containing protein [Boeremia exigua]KAH6622023.1 kinase-like domain-containing protein [Boeremia exigua]